MRRLTLALFVLSGCATLPLAGEAPAAPPAEPVEVAGHVTRACTTPQPQALQQVTVRAAGELDPLETTRTDASGAFRFRVAAPKDARHPLLIEALGGKAIAKEQLNGNGNLVADLTLPCTGG